jgi:protease-4
MGGIERALRAAAAKAKLKDYRIVTFPEPTDRFKALLQQLGGSALSEAALQQAVSRSIQEELPVYRQVRWLLRMNGHAQMMLPSIPEFF